MKRSAAAHITEYPVSVVYMPEFANVSDPPIKTVEKTV